MLHIKSILPSSFRSGEEAWAIPFDLGLIRLNALFLHYVDVDNSGLFCASPTLAALGQLAVDDIKVYDLGIASVSPNLHPESALSLFSHQSSLENLPTFFSILYPSMENT